MATFTPRNTIPSSSDKLWINTGYGGYNRCMVCNNSNGSVMPNCTGYSFGRFMEIMGATACNLSTANAGQWWYYTDDGYSRGQTPQLGAVACWSKAGEAGHVAIVEQVNSDGSYVVSNSAHGGFRDGSSFKMSNSTDAWLVNNYTFQGFIYNPAVTGNTVTASNNVLTKFLSVAKSHVGDGGTWTWTTLGCGEIEWCCAFVMACAKTVGGLLDVVIPYVLSCTELARAGGEGKCGGQFIKGPRKGSNSKPQPGDMILFSNSSDEYTCYHTGIVYEVTDSEIKTVEGNSTTYNKYTSEVSLKSYKMSDNKINGYFRPNWATVGGSVTSMSCYSLYDTYNTRADALFREVGYIKNKELSVSKSDILLSVINYTPLLSSMVSTSSGSGGSVNTDGIENEVCRECIEYFLAKGINAAAACGVCGNIYYESDNFKIGVIEYGKSISTGGAGLCQWTGSRSVAMRNFVGDDWANDLTGQLDYLWYELTSGYTTVLNAMKSAANTEDGAKTVADVFVRKFEIPADPDGQSVVRQAKAAEYFNQLVIEQSSSGNTSLVNQSGQTLTGGTEVVIPSYVHQCGIWDCYTNYNYWYSRWGRSSYQYQVSRLWNSTGRASSRNIATINGYFLIAVKPIYGTVGDLLTVVLSDGTKFNAIMTDAKGTENGTTGYALYGHDNYGTAPNTAVNVIEFEAIGSESTYNKVNGMDLTGWEDKTVQKIINRGDYLGRS